jgi:ADP-ribose pyrophosphatase
MESDKLETISKEVLYDAKWLSLKSIMFKDKLGNIKNWETVERNGSNGAVAIIATLQPSNKILLIEQYRIPLGNYVIEFPAGLIEGNLSAEETAVKELKEETGYVGVIKTIIPPSHSSPGLTNESISLAIMSIDEELAENISPEQELEQSEDIKVITIKKEELFEYLKNRTKDGYNIDSKVISYAIGLTEK